MKDLAQFVIPFGGLKPGKHQFEFEIDESFFKHFEYSQVKQGQIHVHADLEKEETLLVFSFRLEGMVVVTCDLCNEPLEAEVKGTEQLIVKFGPDYHEESETVQVIPEGDKKIDLSPFLYEYVHLLLPVRRVHPPDAEGNPSCDPEILKRMDTRPASVETDPRWDVLKQLKTKN
jgi:uncharacterized metal-binding protein YceD (DUF177 family)